MSITIYPSQFNMREDGGYEQLPAIKGQTGEQGAPGVGALPGGTKGQVPVKQSADDYDVAWEDIGWTKVWENASPSSNFGAQTIGLDLGEYKEVCITAPVWASSTDGGCRNYYGFVGSMISLDAYTSERNSGIASYITNRTANLNSDGVVFSTTTSKPANGTSLNTENDKLIPHRIYAR